MQEQIVPNWGNYTQAPDLFLLAQSLLVTSLQTCGARPPAARGHLAGAHAAQAAGPWRARRRPARRWAAGPAGSGARAGSYARARKPERRLRRHDQIETCHRNLSAAAPTRWRAGPENRSQHGVVSAEGKGRVPGESQRGAPRGAARGPRGPPMSPRVPGPGPAVGGARTATGPGCRGGCRSADGDAPGA